MIMIMILNTTSTLVICVLEAVRGIPKFYEGRVTTREQLWRKRSSHFFPVPRRRGVVLAQSQLCDSQVHRH